MNNNEIIFDVPGDNSCGLHCLIAMYTLVANNPGLVGEINDNPNSLTRKIVDVYQNSYGMNRAQFELDLVSVYTQMMTDRPGISYRLKNQPEYHRLGMAILNAYVDHPNRLDIEANNFSNPDSKNADDKTHIAAHRAAIQRKGSFGVTPWLSHIDFTSFMSLLTQCDGVSSLYDLGVSDHNPSKAHWQLRFDPDMFIKPVWDEPLADDHDWSDTESVETVDFDPEIEDVVAHQPVVRFNPIKADKQTMIDCLHNYLGRVYEVLAEDDGRSGRKRRLRDTQLSKQVHSQLQSIQSSLVAIIETNIDVDFDEEIWGVFESFSEQYPEIKSNFESKLNTHPTDSFTTLLDYFFQSMYEFFGFSLKDETLDLAYKEIKLFSADGLNKSSGHTP